MVGATPRVFSFTSTTAVVDGVEVLDEKPLVVVVFSMVVAVLVVPLTRSELSGASAKRAWPRKTVRIFLLYDELASK